MSTKYRKILILNELEVLTSILIECYSDPPWNETWSRGMAVNRLEELSGTSGILSVGAFVEEKLVGFAMGIPHTGVSGRSLYLAEIAVDPGYQTMGIGRSLLAKLEQLAKRQGYKGVWLVTAKAEHTKHFYSKAKYTESERLTIFVKAL